METYGQLRDKLASLAEQLRRIASHESQAEEIRGKLLEGRFNLAVLGQFKRGKSTLINALLGSPLLPTAIVPLTSVVTVLRYGEELAIEVAFFNGEHRNISLEELPAYITERGNPENKKGVREVELCYPSPLLRDGVRIIDTPGVGSVYQHNTDVAYGIIPRIDAGIFVVTADPPLSESEHRFLKDIRAYASKLFFVLNKVDLVSESDLEEALDFTLSVLKRDLGAEEVRVWPASARLALEGKVEGNPDKLAASRFPEFERRVEKFLLHEKGRVLLSQAISGLLKLVSDETISGRLEQEAMRLPLTELEAKIGRFEAEVPTLEKEREHNGYLLAGLVKKICQGLDADLEGFERTLLPTLTAALEEEYRCLVQAGSSGLRGQLEGFIFERIREEFDRWRAEETDKIAKELAATHDEFAAKTNQLIHRVVELAAGIFALDLQGFTGVDTLSEKGDFSYMFKDDPVGLELIRLTVTSVLPGFLSRGIVIRGMREAVRDLVNRHCGRVRHDLLRRIQTTSRDFESRLNEKLDATLTGIRQALERASFLKRQSESEVAANVSRLEERLSEVDRLRNELLNCQARIATF
jgi:ribosome biogenesis GTPase A/polyhydroxyalkanoate synthesis regulator phasin